MVKARPTADPPAGGTVPAAISNNDDSRMPRVAFNHKAHELADLSCKECHHAAIDSCVSCHSGEGIKIKAGGEVKLADAMHRSGATASCIGCHAQQQRTTPECAGCHYPLAALTTNDAQSCEACHQVPVPTEGQPSLTEAENAATARRWLEGRVMAVPERSKERIPEVVKIGSLSDQFEPATLPHRKIVTKLMDNIQRNQLAAAFHTDPLTLCQGCHHQTPITDKPPRCGSCHDRQTAVKETDRPRLVAAYHQQCMTCHDRMGIVKPATQDCVACHKKHPEG
ncbi:MAG: cytochrome c3 family protein [Desulfosarcinaceae bacterium]